MDQLPAVNFQLRAAKDIFVDLGSDLKLSGFVGGVTGYQSARSVTLNIDGKLTVTSGIVAADDVAGRAAAAAVAALPGNFLPDDLIAANTTVGRVAIKANSISSDGASVFIAYNLVVNATNAVQLNTLVDHISVDSTDSGDIYVNEATGLGVDHVVAKNGTITIAAGGDTYVRDVRNVADGKDITVQASGDLWVDSIESGTAVGAQKTGGTVTVDASGVIREWKGLVRDVSGKVTGTALDQSSPDLYGWMVRVNGTTSNSDTAITTGAPLVLSDPTIAGTGYELEVRYTAATGTGLVTGPTTVNQKTVNSEGGALIPISSTTITQPGTSARQIDQLSFGQVPLATGTRFALQVNGTSYSVAVGQTVNGDLVTASWASVLSTLASEITADGVVTVAVDSNNHLLTFTAVTPNTAFTVSNVVVQTVSSGFLQTAVEADGTAPTQAAGAARYLRPATWQPPPAAGAITFIQNGSG